MTPLELTLSLPTAVTMLAMPLRRCRDVSLTMGPGRLLYSSEIAPKPQKCLIEVGRPLHYESIDLVDGQLGRSVGEI
jgi:hypothetical protein